MDERHDTHPGPGKKDLTRERRGPQHVSKGGGVEGIETVGGGLPPLFNVPKSTFEPR